MWKWIRVGIAGVLIGLLGGVLYIEMGAVRRLYGAGRAIGQMMDAAETETAGAYGETSGQETETAFQILEAETTDAGGTENGLETLTAYYDSLLAALYGEDGDGYDGDTADETDTGETSEVIRLKVIYDGAEELSEQEEQALAECVEQAALYGIANKLGENYNEQEKSTVRSALIMNMEMINACAEEAAEEYGVEAAASSRFRYLSLPEAVIGDAVYPAGYYETLCITLEEK